VVIVGFFLESLHVRLLICHIIRRRKRVIDVVFVDGRVPSKSMNRPNVIHNIHPQPRDKQTHLRLVSWSKVHANSAPGMPRAWTLDGDVDEHVRHQSILSKQLGGSLQYGSISLANKNYPSESTGMHDSWADQNYSECFCGWRRWQRRSLRFGQMDITCVIEMETSIRKCVSFSGATLLAMDWTH
ncbi:hypothetical protein JG688_00000222, partial [Phytophthora aleatoria]